MIHATRRATLKSLLAFGGMASLARVAPAMAAMSDIDFILGTVDADLRPAARRLLTETVYPPIGPDNLAVARSFRPPEAPPPLRVDVRKKVIAGTTGQPEVTIYVVNAKPSGSGRPAILHTHGGGYVIGSAEASLPMLQDICLELDCPAVSVEYRLAPETTFAGSVEDNYAGLKWLFDHADEIGADPRRIALLGESAGGGHAALLAITARDRLEVPVAFQCLIYPMLDDRTGTSRPVPPHIGRLIWTAKSNYFGWKSFLGSEPGRKDVPKGGVPARVRDLGGLPPAFIGVGSIDLFVDEDIDYAQRLLAAGVPAELLVIPGAFHGFDALAPQSPPARRFTAAVIAALRRGLGGSR